MAHFDNDQYTKLISSLPLISIDFIVKNTNEEILLGLRKNNPASGFWFVPGGRIRRMETIAEACSRISNSELGISIEIGETKLIGIFEHMYHNSSYSEDIGVHYI